MTARKINRLMRDDTPIGYSEIADMLGISIETVKRWRPDSTSRLRTRLPEPDAPSEVGPRGGLPGPRWRTSTVVAWAIDPAATGSSRVYLDRRTGEPTTLRRERATVAAEDVVLVADEAAQAQAEAARLRVELDEIRMREVAPLRAEVAELRAVVARVRGLHRHVPGRGPFGAAEPTPAMCEACRVAWPCDTATAVTEGGDR